MKQTPSVGLITAGSVGRTLAAQFPRLPEYLGPVKATSFRVASRIVNALRGGYAVAEYERLNDARLILIHVPDSHLRRVVEELVQSELTWRSKVVLLSSRHRDSESLAMLARGGAAVASMNLVDGLSRQFIVEGERPAIRATRRFLEGQGARTLEIHRHAKPLYLAGLTIATDLLTAIAGAAAESLRKSGLSRVQAMLLVEAWISLSAHSYVKTGKKAWAGPLAREQAEQMRSQLNALCAADPRLARFYLESGLATLRYFERSTKWLEEGLAPRRGPRLVASK